MLRSHKQAGTQRNKQTTKQTDAETTEKYASKQTSKQYTKKTTNKQTNRMHTKSNMFLMNLDHVMLALTKTQKTHLLTGLLKFRLKS